MKAKNYSNPTWWTPENDSAWDRVKAAFQRDWDQTRHHFGGNVPDTKQGVSNTVSQAAGTEPIPPRGVLTYEEMEPAYRLGYGARSHYSTTHPKWDGDLEAELRGDWERMAPEDRDTWPEYRDTIRRGWEYKE